MLVESRVQACGGGAVFVIKGCTMLKTSPSALTLIPQVGGMASITPSVHGNRRELLSLCISYERGGADTQPCWVLSWDDVCTEGT